MNERTTRTSVKFFHPFLLSGVDGMQPAGTYEIETVEEPLDGLSFVAYRRISTKIVLPGSFTSVACRQLSEIDPIDLAMALKQDAEAHSGQSQI